MPYSISSSIKILTLATAPFLFILVGVLSVCKSAMVPDVQGLIQKEKVDIDCQKGAQISTLPNMIEAQVRSPNYPLHLFFIFSLLYSHYIADLIKKLELCLMVVSVLLIIEFGHTQIIMPKIGIPLSITACINPWCVHFAVPSGRGALFFLRGQMNTFSSTFIKKI